MLASLYGVEVHTINYHLKKVFADAELSEDSVIRKFRITAADGKNYRALHYGIQAVIAVGFKVNSKISCLMHRPEIHIHVRKIIRLLNGVPSGGCFVRQA